MSTPTSNPPPPPSSPSPIKPILLRGLCACTSTTFTSTSPALHLDFCYCTLCQRVTGAPFGAWAGIPKSALTWSGPIAHYKISEIATRSLCVQCGATLSIQYDCYPGKTHVAAGLVVEGAEEGLPKGPGVHIFVEECPAWYGIPEDGVRRWEGFDEEFLGVMKGWEEAKKKKAKE